MDFSPPLNGKPSIMKDWDKIAKSLPSPSDSDEEDGVNIVKVQKNAQMISDRLQHLLPGLDPAFRRPGDEPSQLRSSAEFKESIRKSLARSADLEKALEERRK
jgi:hypothetical protein